MNSYFYESVIKFSFANLDQLPLLKSCVAPYIENNTKNIVLAYFAACDGCLKCGTESSQGNEETYSGVEWNSIAAWTPKTASVPSELYKNNFRTIFNATTIITSQQTGNYEITYSMASKAALFVTFLHEMIHIKLGYKNSTSPDGLNDADHEDIAGFVTEMASDLFQYCKLNSISLGTTEKIQLENAEYLCWSGLENTEKFKAKFGIEGSRTLEQQTAYNKFKEINKKYGSESQSFDLDDPNQRLDYDRFTTENAAKMQPLCNEEVEQRDIHLGVADEE